MKIILLIIIQFVLISCSSFNTEKLKSSKWFPKAKKVQKNEPFLLAWTKNYDPEYETGNLPVSMNYPLAHDGLLFLGHNSGKMNAHDLETGRVIWSKKDVGGYSASPVIYKDFLIYGTTEGRVYSRNYLTGKLNYVVDLGASIESEAVVYKGRVFFHLRNHKIFSLDVATGKILWAYRRSVPFLTTVQRVSHPVVYNGKLYVGFADGNMAAFSIEEGILLWERKLSSASKFVDVDQRPFFFNRLLMASSLAGPMTILEPKTGQLVRYLDFTPSRAPIRLGKGLLVGGMDGEIRILDENFKTIRKVELNSGTISSYVVWNDKIVVSTVSGRLILLDRKTFSIEKIKFLGHASSAVFGKMIVAEDRLAVLSSRNRLYVFK